MKTNNIVLINPYYGLPIPAVKGGAVETLEDLLIEENENQGKVNLYVVQPGEKNSIELGKNVTLLKIKNGGLKTFLTRVLNKCFRLLHIKRELILPYDKRVLKEVKKINNPKIIFEGNCPRNLLSKYAGIWGRENLYLHFHSRFNKKNGLKPYIRNFISISDYITNDWVSEVGDDNIKIYTLRNCVDEQRFNKRISKDERFAIRNRLGFSDDDIVVVFCGRIIPEKGVKELISAILEVDNPKVKLLIIGSPCFAVKTKTEYLEEVEKLVVKAGQRIKFTGYIPNIEMYKYYQIADMQVVPSIWQEPAGLVVVEGAMSGLPQICTSSGGMPEYFSDGGVVAVNLSDDIVKQLTEKIGYLANNKEVRENMSAKNLVGSKKFKKEEYYNNFIKIFEEV